jgi:hypothetical protein
MNRIAPLAVLRCTARTRATATSHEPEIFVITNSAQHQPKTNGTATYPSGLIEGIVPPPAHPCFEKTRICPPARDDSDVKLAFLASKPVLATASIYGPAFLTISRVAIFDLWPFVPARAPVQTFCVRTFRGPLVALARRSSRTTHAEDGGYGGINSHSGVDFVGNLVL